MERLRQQQEESTNRIEVARRVKVKQRKHLKNDPNLLSYKDIIRYDAKGYTTAILKDYEFLKGYKADKMDLDLAGEIITTSKLAWIKFLYFNLAVIFLIASIVSLILSVILRGGVF